MLVLSLPVVAQGPAVLHAEGRLSGPLCLARASTGTRLPHLTLHAHSVHSKTSLLTALYTNQVRCSLPAFDPTAFSLWDLPFLLSPATFF